ncbi:hypothetical protein ACKWTF_015955 [Chironomus riparius]
MQTNKIIFNIFSAFLFQIIVINSTFSASKSPNSNRIKSVECKSLDNKTVEFEFCYAKAFSRKTTAFNVKFKLHRIMQKPFYIQYILSRRTSGNVCQNIFKSDLIEFCGLMDGMDANPMIKNIILILNETAPTLFHKCPYEGETAVTNATIQDDKALFFIPTGTYCSEVNFFDNKKKQYVNVKMINDIKNSLDILGITERKN